MPFLTGYALTHQGARHAASQRPNQDAAVCHPDDGIFAALDGIEPFLFGEHASRIAAEWLRKRCTGEPNVAAMQGAFAMATTKMLQYMAGRQVRGDMGCCVTALWLMDTTDGFSGFIGHTGDTSGFIFVHGTLIRLTTPHTEEGHVSRWVGSGCLEQASVTPLTVPRDAWVLLVSDGITKKIPDADLESWMQAHADGKEPQEIAEALAALAISRSENDDITIVVLRT